MAKRKILLDKNFLQGSSTKMIRDLAETHTLLMPDVLFYEMISCDEPARSQCFAKLPPGENPVVLLKHLGGLLSKEMDTHQPCGLPSDNMEEIRYQFNPALSAKGYELPEEAVRQLAVEHETLKLEVAQYLQRAATVKNLFTAFGTAKGKKREELRADAEGTIADFEHMRAFYESMASHSPPGPYNPPSVALVGPDWACVRLMQVQLLFGVDIWYRFGDNFPVEPTGAAYERFEHDVLDANYLIMGVLQGSLATHEKKLRRWFRLLRPDGHLYPDDGSNLMAE
jgi:hypothetical protein